MNTLSFFHAEVELVRFQSKADYGVPWVGIPRKGETVVIDDLPWIVADVVWTVGTGWLAAVNARVVLDPLAGEALPQNQAEIEEGKKARALFLAMVLALLAACVAFALIQTFAADRTVLFGGLTVIAAIFSVFAFWALVLNRRGNEKP